MPTFAPDFALQVLVAGRALLPARFVAVTERLARAADEDLLAGHGPRDLLAFEAPEHLQPADVGAAWHDGRAPFRAVAYLRPLPDDDEADAELVVPVFSHN